MPSESNHLLRTAREAVGMTQGQLAEVANAQVELATTKPGAMDSDYISKLERGIHRWPSRHYRAALRQALHRETDAELGFFGTRSRPEHVEGGDDVERKVFLRVLAGSVAGVAFSDPLRVFSADAVEGKQRRVGRAEVDQVTASARMFAGQDHAYGGGMSSHAVVAHLSVSAGLLDGRAPNEEVRRQLLAAVADLADVAGGMCFDAGSHATAERCFRFAVGCAVEAGNWPMRAKALSGLTNLAVHQGRPDDALSYSEMALVRADRLTPVVRAVTYTRHARALGVSRGRENDCRAAVDKAEDCFVNDPGGEPDWISYYGSGHLERDIGRALLQLAVNGGDHLGAQTRLGAAVTCLPVRSRARTLAIADLAHLTMAKADADMGVTLGHEALDSIGSIRSDRILEALRRLRAAGHRHRRVPAIHELNQRINTVLRSTSMA